MVRCGTSYPPPGSLREPTSPARGEVHRVCRSFILSPPDPIPAYSTFSTYTRILPPQERPTFQAVSSATPNSRVRGLPLSITSIASVTTAPSTQPPETEPRKLPWSSITRLEPTGRGAEPQVSTTVASATPRPALRQSSAALRMSSSLASMNASVMGCVPTYLFTRPCPTKPLDRLPSRLSVTKRRPGPASRPDCGSAA